MEGNFEKKCFHTSETYLNSFFRNKDKFHVKPLLKVRGCGKSKGLQILIDSNKEYSDFAWSDYIENPISGQSQLSRRTSYNSPWNSCHQG